jgi:FkbM family methyltransferase
MTEYQPSSIPGDSSAMLPERKMLHGLRREGKRAYVVHPGDPRFDIMVHDPAFHPFVHWHGMVDPGLAVSWNGALTRGEFAGWNTHEEEYFAKPSLPSKDNDEYAEWVALMQSILDARRRDEHFTAVELGAGWGRWIVNGAVLIDVAKELGEGFEGMTYHLVGVEAEPRHFEWMKQHLSENDVMTTDARLYQAAVAAEDGEVEFQVGNAAEWYGQSIARPQETVETTKVEAVSLATVLTPIVRCDFLDLDVQGSELEVLAACPDFLVNKVARVFVGTHSYENELGCRALFAGLHWFCEDDYSLNGNRWTRWGWAKFGDGVQVWRNPRFD